MDKKTSWLVKSIKKTNSFNHLIIFKKFLLKGGKIIEFYTKGGEDATLPIQEFHNRSTKKVAAIMNSLKKRAATPQERIVIKTFKYWILLFLNSLLFFSWSR